MRMRSYGWPLSALRMSQDRPCSWMADCIKACKRRRPRPVRAGVDAPLHSQEEFWKGKQCDELASRMAVMTGEGALSVYARAKELEREGRSIIHLELGEPDFHPSASVNEALKRAVDDGKDRYCAVAGVLTLREAIAFVSSRHSQPESFRRQHRHRAGLQNRPLYGNDGAHRSRRRSVVSRPGVSWIPVHYSRARAAFLYHSNSPDAIAFNRDPERNRSKDYTSHKNPDRELPGQSDRHDLYRRSAASTWRNSP